MNSYSRKITFSNRYVFLYIFVFAVTLILFISLFNLQIVNGEDYRKQSENRLLREKTVQAPRGEFYDRNGNVLVTNEMGFSLLLYKTNTSKQVLNESLLQIIKILDKNEDKYIDTLPIYINQDGNAVFTFSGDNAYEKESAWKKKYNYDETLTAYDILMKLKDKYDIVQEDLRDIRIIAGQRFDIQRCGYSAYNPYQISTSISRESVNEIEEQNASYQGINISTVPIRSYLRGSLASHILGYTGPISSDDLKIYPEYGMNDTIGKSGLESVFEKYLRGTNGINKVEMDSNGRMNQEYPIEPSIKGSDIILTIDANLQQVAETALADNINKIATGGFRYKYEDADSGAVVVLNVKTGEVLAMASYPTYNPSLFTGGISNKDWNDLINNPATPLYNRAIQAMYAPGSTFKMVTAIAGLENKSITIDEKILDTGIYDKGHKPQCWYYSSYGLTHGEVNVTEAIKTSCNCFFYETGYRMGIDTLSKYATYFGLGSKTGIELQGEKNGTLASREYSKSKGNEWYVADTLSAAIGQSYNSFTPLQLATYIAILSNGGNKIQPTLIKDILSSDGLSYNKEEIQKYVNEKIGLPDVSNIENLSFAKQNIQAVLQGMKDVTDESGGTAYGLFKSLPVAVGGKTGTAEAGAGSNNGVFVGFAPFDDPEIAVAVVVEHGGHGSYTGEVVRDIMKEYFGVNSQSATEDKTVKNMGMMIE